jgi:hypothetical protein
MISTSNGPFTRPSRFYFFVFKFQQKDVGQQVSHFPES